MTMPSNIKQEGSGSQAEVSQKPSANSTSPGSIPTISLPKGGGAIRGIGEKFAANPVTGTGSMTVPIAVTPGRSGFSPQLTLSYDSGAGNGPFGLGWNLSLPAITRKTDKGLPKYRDDDESDVFILSGAEDLVPQLNRIGDEWQPDVSKRTVSSVEYLVKRYRPRVEGLFARIEQWTNLETNEKHWRSISKDNITTLYGRTSESRIADPDDPLRMFTWLICESRDDKGNAIVYEYKAEDSGKIDLAQAHESNRSSQSRSANRYLKRIKYGNRTSHLIQPDLSKTGWLFEVVFDYNEGHYEQPPTAEDAPQFVKAGIAARDEWSVRNDPFSTFRAGFEVRSYRLCRRALMFHHFPQELGTDDYLVRSTEFSYRETPLASFINTVTQSGYVRQPNGTYLKKSLPPLEFEYSEAVIQSAIREVDPESLENLPSGLDGSQYQWVDLDGEGISGILTEQADAWFYKPNQGEGHFGAVQLVALKPSIADLKGGQQLMDLAGDGQLDLVQFAPPLSGFHERTYEGGWSDFRPFPSVPNLDWRDPNLKFVDLTGDGHADILVSEDEAFTWYPSLAEDGFGPGERTRQSFDEEKGPHLLLADRTQSIFLADVSGDGLGDLVRIRNGEVCYWPNLGYGRFGAKVTMDDAPWFDLPDQFDQRRIRLADIDGSGVTDIIYLNSRGIDLYFNQSGNSWSKARRLDVFPTTDNLSSITVVDLLGNGTACLVWSSPLPGHARQPMRYVELMDQKPHLLMVTKNNLGAETRVQYAASTKFYLADKAEGRSWITRLPFPVHVVERVETLDRISRNRFVTRYAYHHGYFDGIEREFRGFGMVEQFDTEEFATLNASDTLPEATNIDQASHVPPVLTKTWFHTGPYFERGRISKQFEHEYYHEGDPSLGEGALSDEQLEAMLLPDTVLPDGLSLEEEREACRALKGSILRQEIYALDHSEAEDRPYSVSERNYAIRLLQPREVNQHSVFFTHASETIDFHYERKLYDIAGQKRADPRVTHNVVLDFDEFGNVLKEVAIGYGRRFDDPDPVLTDADRAKQKQTLLTVSENRYTNAVQDLDDHRTPLLCESRTFELIKVSPDLKQPGITNLFRFNELAEKVEAASDGQHDLPYEDIKAIGATAAHAYRRLIEHVRTLYRRNDLTGPLELSKLESRALPFESYKLAFTPGLIQQVYDNRVTDAMLTEGGYVHTEGDSNWWIPSGRILFSPNAADAPTPELSNARTHFFLPRRLVDPFGNATTVTYDARDLLLAETRDAMGNTVRSENDYRVIQTRRVTDPNGNRSEVAFDALGLIVGTAVMGKESETLGDSLVGFDPDLDHAVVVAHLRTPFIGAHDILQRATTRLVYDLHQYQRSAATSSPQPNVVYALARETHTTDLTAGVEAKIQHGFSYSDGFGREIQKKVQAAPGRVDPDDPASPVANPRWVGSGWTIFNNKGKPVRQYEPFFDDAHNFRFGHQVGVSPILFYDPAERVIATMHPNHTFEKVVFDPWQQTTCDANDTVALDPRTDDDIKGYTEGYFKTQPVDWKTWLQQRAVDPVNPPADAQALSPEKRAAVRTLPHARTPTVAYFDTLGRTFLTIADNGKDLNAQPQKYHTRVEFDIEGNQRALIDGRARAVMRYDYDLLSNHIHQNSMDAGERWMLNDVMGKPIRTWDTPPKDGQPGHNFRTEYDQLRRPVRSFVKGLIENNPDHEILYERNVYGEKHPRAEALNLRTRVFLQFDGAGMVRNGNVILLSEGREEAYDFKGNLLRSSRRLAKDYKNTPDWKSLEPLFQPATLDLGAIENGLMPLLEAEFFESSTRYDALKRPIQIVAPHSSVFNKKRNVIRPGYNEANLLERVDVWLERDDEPAALLDRATAEARAGVSNIDYNAKGQRQQIGYKNGVGTSYTYEKETFRLIRLETLRGADRLQDLKYSYDPAANITSIRDDAQQTLIFGNQLVEPHNDYTYDAIYRLIKATGREHLGQTANPPTPYDEFNLFHIRRDPNDPNVMGRYLEEYGYDEVGNILFARHRGADPQNPGWKRCYQYAENSNRLLSTSDPKTAHIPDDACSPHYAAAPVLAEKYGYDTHGNMTSMPHLPAMGWGFHDQLRNLNLGGGGNAFYVYDASRQRTRKVWEKNGQVDECIYLGGFDVFRRRNGTGGAVTLERETLHIMDDKQQIAFVETRTEGSDPAPRRLIRYQLGNHLGSSALELDHESARISYEEYAPYGSTSYQAVRSQIETPKRYRYTGKERDEETGFSYHGARYYAQWLGRWTSCDAKGTDAGVNLYVYVVNNPIRLLDPNGMQPTAQRQNDRNPANPLNYVSFEEYAKNQPTPISPSVLRQEWSKAHALATDAEQRDAGQASQKSLSQPAANRIEPRVISEGGPSKPWIEQGIFSATHPIIASEIGEVRLRDLSAENISTVAARFAIKSGLENRVPGAGEGTEVNALRHATWQSIISSRFGEDIAKKVGYAHEENPSVNRGVTDFSNIVFTSLKAADQSADLANNVIGREIGTANKGLSSQQLALKALEYFHEKGLWMAVKQADGTYKIEQTKLSDEKFKAATERINQLNDVGLTPQEQKQKENLQHMRETFQQPRWR